MGCIASAVGAMGPGFSPGPVYKWPSSGSRSTWQGWRRVLSLHETRCDDELTRLGGPPLLCYMPCHSDGVAACVSRGRQGAAVAHYERSWQDRGIAHPYRVRHGLAIWRDIGMLRSMAGVLASTARPRRGQRGRGDARASRLSLDSMGHARAGNVHVDRPDSQ